MSQSLGLSMIVKDAEADLARCLESTHGVVDEIVIGDTGSTDASVEIASRYGARVIAVPWENDFSKARNRVLEENRADWILFMDADEVLDPVAPQSIPALLARQDLAGYKVTIWNYVLTLTNRLWDTPAKPNPNRLEGARQYPAYVEHQNIRLFRRHPDIYFEGRVHETTGYRILATGRQLGEADFVIHHFGLAVDAETRLRKSKFYRELGREKVREKPNDAQAHFELGIEELDTFRDPAAALACFERVIELNPKSHRAWAFAGIALVRLERYPEGLKRLKRAEQLGGRSVLVFETQGDAYYHAGDFHAACRCYRKAQEFGGAAAIVESKLGVSEARLGRTAAGLRHMERAIEREPNFSELYDILIMAAVWMGNPKLAAETADRRLTAVEPTAENFLRAASIRAQLGEWPRVEEILRAGRERFPDSPKLHQAWAELQQRTGQSFTAVTSA
ncbi:MAG TPA: glycosyltransferase [Terriglobia bacterium]|nr:glycosyltransferase [Terriglobia bacterium]